MCRVVPTKTLPLVASLGPAEALLVRLVRRAGWADCRCGLMRREFRDVFGPATQDMAQQVFALLTLALARHRRRPLRIGVPGWPLLLPDEAALASVLAAAQRQDNSGLEAHLLWLVRSGGLVETAGYAMVLADLMAQHGCRFGAVADTAVAALGRPESVGDPAATGSTRSPRADGDRGPR